MSNHQRDLQYFINKLILKQSTCEILFSSYEGFFYLSFFLDKMNNEKFGLAILIFWSSLLNSGWRVLTTKFFIYYGRSVRMSVNDVNLDLFFLSY